MALSRWVSTRRHDHRTGHPDADQITQLQALPGWSWGTSQRQRWNHTFDVLRAYTAQHGTAAVPASHVVSNIRLGAWVSRQRAAHRHRTLPNHRAAALESAPTRRRVSITPSPTSPSPIVNRNAKG